MKTSGSLSNKKSMKSKRGRSVSSKKHKIAKKVTGRSFKRKGTKKLRKKKMWEGGHFLDDRAAEGDSADSAARTEAAEKEAEAENARFNAMSNEEKIIYNQRIDEKNKKNKEVSKRLARNKERGQARENAFMDKYKEIIALLLSNLKEFCGECKSLEKRAGTQKGFDLPDIQQDTYLTWKTSSPEGEKKGWFGTGVSVGSGWSAQQKKDKIIALQNEALDTLFKGVIANLSTFSELMNTGSKTPVKSDSPHTTFVEYLKYFKYVLLESVDDKNHTSVYFLMFSSRPPTIQYDYETPNYFRTRYLEYVKWLKNIQSELETKRIRI